MRDQFSGPEADRPTESLRENALRSAKWVALSRVVIESLSFAAVILTARLLTPAEVGTAVLPLVLGALAGGLLGGSIASPLIAAERVGNRQIEVAVLMSFVFGVVLTGATCLMALALVGPLGSGVAELLVLASPMFLAASIAAVPQALRSRRLAFRTLTLMEMVGSAAGSVTAVVLAALDVGSASLVLGSLATSVVIMALCLFGSDARWPRWHPAEAREILSFGIPASLSSLLNTATRNVDFALLSVRLPASQVGFYFRAYTLAVDYQLKFSNIVVRILFPVLSRTDSDNFEKVRSRVIRFHSIVLFPFLALLAVVAPEFVPLLFGEAWAPAVLPTQILVGSGVATTIGTGIGPIMMAAGRPRALLINNTVSFVGFGTTVYVVSAYGLIATCVAVVVYRLLALAVSQYALATRLLGIPLRQTLFVDPGPAAIASLTLVAAAAPTFHLATSADLPAALTVALSALVGFVAYLAMLRLGFADAWRDVRMVAERVLPQSVQRALARTKIDPASSR